MITIKSLSQDISFDRKGDKDFAHKGTENYLVIEKPDGSIFRLPVSEDAVKIFVQELKEVFTEAEEPVEPPQQKEENFGEPSDQDGFTEFGGEDNYEEEQQQQADDLEDDSPNDESEVPSL